MLKLVMPGSTTTAGIEITTEGVIVGRERGCDLMLCSKNVSRQHARLSLRNQIVYVEDLGSFNGTQIDGNRIQGLTELRLGSSVTFGDLTFFLIDDVPLKTGSAESREKTVSRDHVVPLLQTADIAEPKAVRQFANRSREKEKPSRTKGDSVAPSNSVTPKHGVESSIAPSGLRRTSARGTCIVLFILLLVGGFVLGRGVRHLGTLELHGEREAIENLNTPEPAPVEQSPIQDSENSQDVTQPGNPSPHALEPRANASSPQNPVFSAAKPSSKDSPNIPDSETAGEMSISDSGKALKLIKEVQRLKIDMRDEAAVFKVATQQLGMSPEQATRVVNFVTMMAERKAIMEGGIDAIAKLNSKPRAITPAPASTHPPGSTSSTPNETPPLNSASAGDPPRGMASLTALPSDAEKNAPANASVAETPSASNAVVLAPVKRGPGFYLNFWGLVLVIGLLLIWRNAVDWIGRDTQLNGIEKPSWLGLYSLAGPTGAMILFSCPDLGWGTLLNSACIGGPLLAYLARREELVPGDSRVLKLPKGFGQPDEKSLELEPASQPRIEFLAAESVQGRSTSARPSRVNDAQAMQAAKALIASAVARRASEIHLEPEGDDFAARLRIDGIMRSGDSYPDQSGNALINVFKAVASIDIPEGRRSQDGRFRVQISDEILNIGVATQGTSRREKLTLRLLRDQEELTNISGLGCNRKIQGELRDIMGRQEGLFLVCGPPGAGKSTTLRSAVGELDPKKLKIMTIENPIEYRMPDVTQIEIHQNSDQSFATALQSVLRRDPDVLMIGEVRDLETATAACQAANTGHLVLSTVHANDALTAVHRLIDLGADPSTLAEVLTGVLGQRLIRRLCPICKVQFQPDAELLRRYRIPNDRERILYGPPRDGSKCDACEGEGYRGRIGIFELLMADGATRTLIRDRASPTQIKDAARRQGMTTLRESGFMVALRGLTSLEEVDSATKSERT